MNDIREETVTALLEAGLRQVFLGLESGSDRALRRMEKLTTVAQNERAVSTITIVQLLLILILFQNAFVSNFLSAIGSIAAAQNEKLTGIAINLAGCYYIINR